MTYEQWLSDFEHAPGGLVSLAAVAVSLLLAFGVGWFCLRHYRDMGSFRRWLGSILCGFAAFVLGLCILIGVALGVTQQTMLAEYPAYAAQYEQEKAGRAAEIDAAQHERNVDDWNYCQLMCDVPPECQGLAPLDGAGQTTCVRARRACRAGCDERYPTH